MLACIITALLAGCAQASSAAGNSQWNVDAAEWVMEGGWPDRSRKSAENTAPPLAVERIYSIGGDTQYVSPVTVAQDLVFAEGPQTLHVLDGADGKEQWKINLAGAYLSPAVDGDSVFVRVESGADGYIFALSLDAGDKLWEFKFPYVGSSYDNVGGHVTSPVIADGLVLVGAAQTLFALDAATSNLVWQFDLDDPVASSAAVAGEIVYVTDFMNLYAVDLHTGKELWRYNHDVVTLLFAPIVVGDRIVITVDDSVIVLNRLDGKVLWSKEFSDTAVIPAAASPDRVYVKSTTSLMALNLADGNPLWKYDATNFISLPALTNEYAYVITRAEASSQLRALRLADGVEVWSNDHSELANAAPVAAAGRIFVRTVDGEILSYQPTKE